MPTANVEVDTDHIARVQSTAKQTLTDTLNSQLEAMRLAIEELDGLWEGPNHDSFASTFRQRYSDLHAFNVMLESYLAAVEKAREAYERCESDVAQYVR